MASCFLPSASCLLSSAASWLLLPASCLLRANRQPLLQNFFLRYLDRHSVSLTILIDWTLFEHVVPLLAQSLDFPKRIFGLPGLVAPGASDSSACIKVALFSNVSPNPGAPCKRGSG